MSIKKVTQILAGSFLLVFMSCESPSTPDFFSEENGTLLISELDQKTLAIKEIYIYEMSAKKKFFPDLNALGSSSVETTIIKESKEIENFLKSVHDAYFGRVIAYPKNPSFQNQFHVVFVFKDQNHLPAYWIIDRVHDADFESFDLINYRVVDGSIRVADNIKFLE